MNAGKPVLSAVRADGENQPLRVVIYARRSHSGGTSADDQVRMGREDAEANGWTIVAEHSESGQSASMYRADGRPRAEWAKVQALVDSGAVDLVWVRETSRADRTPRSWSAFLDEMRIAGVRLHVRNDRRTYDLADWNDHKALLHDGIENADESAKKAKRVKDGLDDHVRRGLPTTPAPLGYRNVYDGRRRLAGREVDPLWKSTAIKMFERVGRGDSLSSVADWLNKVGAPLRGGGFWRDRENNPKPAEQQIRKWTQKAVRAACEDRAYVAERLYTFGGDQEPTISAMKWEPLVTREQWAATQRALGIIEKTHAVRGRAPGGYRHLLSNIATCHAGCPLRAEPGRRGSRIYACTNGAGRHVSINGDDLERYVTDLVLNRLARGDLLASLMRVEDDDVRQAESAVAELETELSALELEAGRRKGRARLAVVDAIEATERELDLARGRLDSLQTPPALGDLAKVASEGLVAIRATWKDMKLPARREAVRLLLPELVILPAPLAVDDDGNVILSSRTGRPKFTRAVRGAVDPRRVRHRFIGEDAPAGIS